MIEDFFLPGGGLDELIPRYHPRSAQIQAAERISDAFASYTNIAIEAPTGSGKTMAYLVPAYADGGRVIISTKTKQLMSQLLQKDIPVVQQLFGERDVASLKGRKNYFCPHRFVRWIVPNSYFYEDVMHWYEAMAGEISELPVGVFDANVLDKMSADSHQCKYNKCQYFAVCPFRMARKKANEANLVITNHHMLLTDIAMAAGDDFSDSFQGADHIIFDEAHSLADIYAMFAGVELSLWRIVALMHDHKDRVDFADLRALQDAATGIQSSLSADGKLPYERVQAEVQNFMHMARVIADTAADADLTDEFARWEENFRSLEASGDGLKVAENRGRDSLMKYIPLEAGGEFMTGLEKIALSSLFISATLTVDGNFDYFLREVGLVNRTVTTVQLPQVFNMRSQALLYLPEDENNKDVEILNLVRGVEGSVLVICNSLKRMQQLIEYLSEMQEEKAVFSQNDGDWSVFTSGRNIVLVGSATLREGLDLAGGDFRCVVIDKLPFEYPHDLYLSSKAQKVEESVGNAFMNFNLPRAVLYFKQAAGRLIRHESDRGALAVFDRRILTKRYGKYFLNVLDNVEITNSLSYVEEFLS